MTFDLQKIVGTECPDCGCEDSAEVRPGRVQCNHCGREFNAQTTDQSKVAHYIEKRIPICPVHNVPMHNNGRPNLASSRGERSVYYKCPCPGCSITDKGGERIV